jgi:Xaa-Pro dipeptidase
MAIDVQLPFSIEEYQQRMTAVRSAMAERGADVVIVDETEHLAYLTGFGPSATMYQACLIPRDGTPIMVLRRLDEPTFLERTWLTDYVTFGDAEDPVAVVTATLAEQGWSTKRIGLELDSNYLTARRYLEFVAALPQATIVDFSRVLWEQRLRKSPAEIEFLRRAARVADEAMIRAISAVGEGVSERAAAIAASRAFLELGADGSHVGRIASGGRTGSLHGALRDHRLARGDVIHLELCPQINGYSARLMRPAVVGVPDTDQAKTARLLIEIQDKQLAALRPGIPATEVDRITRNGVVAAGLRESYDNATGYTLGYYGTPYPARSSDFTRILIPTADWLLESGMVFHLYTSARGLAFSETVLITEAGHERLTCSERRLLEC